MYASPCGYPFHVEKTSFSEGSDKLFKETSCGDTSEKSGDGVMEGRRWIPKWKMIEGERY